MFQQADSRKLKLLSRKAGIMNDLVAQISQSSPKGVYIYTVNDQHLDLEQQSTISGETRDKGEVIHEKYPNIMFLDTAWELLQPSNWYFKLLRDCLGASNEEIEGKFTGDFDCYTCSEGGKVFKPIVEAGKYNPYKKMLTARSSTSRRFKILKYLKKASKNEAYVLQTVLTVPKEYSDLFLDDDDGLDKYKKCVKVFMKKFRDYLLPEKLKNSNYEMGYWVNYHVWSSKTPFNFHMHAHLCYPNLFYDKVENKFLRFQPYFSEGRVAFIKGLWRDALIEGLNLTSTTTIYGDHKKLIMEGDLNIHHNYASKPGQQLHLLKYCTRSWLHDVGKYFMNCNEDNDDVRFTLYYNWMKKRFNIIAGKGAIQNRTYVYGFLHNTKKILINNDLYFEFKDDKKRACDICGHEIIGKTTVHGFADIGQLALFQAHKSKYKIIGKIEFINK